MKKFIAFIATIGLAASLVGCTVKTTGEPLSFEVLGIELRGDREFLRLKDSPSLIGVGTVIAGDLRVMRINKADNTFTVVDASGNEILYDASTGKPAK